MSNFSSPNCVSDTKEEKKGGLPRLSSLTAGSNRLSKELNQGLRESDDDLGVVKPEDYWPVRVIACHPTV